MERPMSSTIAVFMKEGKKKKINLHLLLGVGILIVFLRHQLPVLTLMKNTLYYFMKDKKL